MEEYKQEFEKFVPTQAQEDFFKSSDKTKIFLGPNRVGKTCLGVNECLRVCEEQEGRQCVVFLDNLFSDQYQSNIVREIKKFAKLNFSVANNAAGPIVSVKFSNGSKITFMSVEVLNNPENFPDRKLESGTFGADFLWVDSGQLKQHGMGAFLSLENKKNNLKKNMTIGHNEVFAPGSFEKVSSQIFAALDQSDMTSKAFFKSIK